MNSNKQKQIGIFGSAFNPLTLAHQYIIKQAMSQVQQLWLIPSANPPHKKINVDFERRFDILKKVYKTEIKTGKIKVLDVDQKLLESNIKPSTYNTINNLCFYGKKPVFFVGEDNKNLDNFEYREWLLSNMDIVEIVLPEELNGIRSSKARQYIDNLEKIFDYIDPQIFNYYNKIEGVKNV